MDVNILHNKAFVVINIQNDIEKNYKEIIYKINQAIDIASEERKITENEYFDYILSSE